jgi:hypothetical protein
MLGFDAGAGAHLGPPSLVERYEPGPGSPRAPVDHRREGVVAVLLEALLEHTVLREPFLRGPWRRIMLLVFLQTKEWKQTNHPS